MGKPATSKSSSDPKPSRHVGQKSTPQPPAAAPIVINELLAALQEQKTVAGVTQVIKDKMAKPAAIDPTSTESVSVFAKMSPKDAVRIMLMMR